MLTLCVIASYPGIEIRGNGYQFVTSDRPFTQCCFYHIISFISVHKSHLSLHKLVFTAL